MRASVVGSNGAICDKCGKVLHPKEVIKLKTLQLDLEIDNTGRYKTVFAKDLCLECSKDLERWFLI